MKPMYTQQEGRSNYIAPQIEWTAVEVEKGFAGSEYPGGGVEPMHHDSGNYDE